MACYAVKGSVATLPACAPLTAQAGAASGRYEDGSGGQAKEAELRERWARGKQRSLRVVAASSAVGTPSVARLIEPNPNPHKDTVGSCRPV